MGHGKNSSVMVLIITGQFAFNRITRTTGPDSWIAHISGKRTAPLYNKIRNNPVKSKSVIEPFFCKCDEVFHSTRSIRFKETDLHCTFGSLYFCRSHVTLRFREVQLRKQVLKKV